MTARAISHKLTIEASKTRCDGCRFQHSEVNYCILFERSLRRECEKVSGTTTWYHRRIEECVRAEWRARKESNANNPAPRTIPEAGPYFPNETLCQEVCPRVTREP